MSIEFNAVYAGGVLKPEHPLPLIENETVRLVIADRVAIARRFRGIMGFNVDRELADKIALDPELDILESP